MIDVIGYLRCFDSRHCWLGVGKYHFSRRCCRIFFDDLYETQANL